jgi:hypothetical protein
VQVRYRYRLDPPRMWAHWRGHPGCVRVVFNDALYVRQQAHPTGLPCLPWPALAPRGEAGTPPKSCRKVV